VSVKPPELLTRPELLLDAKAKDTAFTEAMALLRLAERSLRGVGLVYSAHDIEKVTGRLATAQAAWKAAVERLEGAL
jgi:hypothetical protein